MILLLRSGVIFHINVPTVTAVTTVKKISVLFERAIWHIWQPMWCSQGSVLRFLQGFFVERLRDFVCGEVAWFLCLERLRDFLTQSLRLNDLFSEGWVFFFAERLHDFVVVERLLDFLCKEVAWFFVLRGCVFFLVSRSFLAKKEFSGENCFFL